MTSDEYETELTADREVIAAVLNGVADGIRAGAIRLGDDADVVSIDAPDELSLEIELETEDDEVSLELELEWDADDPVISSVESSTEDETEVQAAADIEVESAEGETDEDGAETGAAVAIEEPTLVGAADDSQSLARFEVYRDRGDEWRWRLRHRNGNIIAISGEGYTRKHNVMKGIRSVTANASNAAIEDGSTN